MVINGRHLKQLWKPELQLAVREAAEGVYPLYVMFPGPGAVDLATCTRGAGSETTAGAADAADGVATSGAVMAGAAGSGRRAGGSPRGPDNRSTRQDLAERAEPSCAPHTSRTCHYVLVVIDGTWQHAKEMFQELRSRLVASGGPGLQVQLAMPPRGQTDTLPLAAAPSFQGQTTAETQPQGQLHGGHASVACAVASTAGGSDSADLAAETDPAPKRLAPQPQQQDAELATPLQLQEAPPSPQLPPSPAAGPSQQPAGCGTGAAAAAGILREGALEAGEALSAGVGSEGHGQGSGRQQQPYLLLMEPMPGCVTTCEAVARAVGLLEPQGSRVQEALLKPLAMVAALQAQWDPAVRARVQGEGAQYTTGKRRFGMGSPGQLST